MDLGTPFIPFEHTSVETFLAALTNCPDLETLSLVRAGPNQLNGNRDNCDRMVQLCKLQELSLKLPDPSTVRCILSHIKYPASTMVRLEGSAGPGTDLSEAISQLLPHRHAGTLQHSQRSKALTVRLDGEYTFFTDDLFICFYSRPYPEPRYSPPILSRRDTITSLNIQAWNADFPGGMWEVFLHGLPRLERIRYDFEGKEGNERLADPFVQVFSQPFEGGLVCPELQYLELPRRVLTQHPSAVVLKRALAGRSACARRLKRIGLT